MTSKIVGIKYVCSKDKIENIARYTETIRANEDLLIVDLYETPVELLKNFLTTRDIDQIREEGISLLLFVNANANYDKILL